MAEEQEIQEVEVEEAVETETVEQDTEPTAEVEEAEVETQEEEAEELPVKMVPVDALQDERRKRQAAEDRLKGFEQGVASVKTQAPPATLEEAFSRDPKGVMSDLNLEIRRLREEDPAGNAVQIDTLVDKKADLRNLEFQNIQSQLNQQTSVQKVLSIVTREIPDFNQKVAKLEAFAVEELDYTLEEFRQRTAPELGDQAAKEFLRVNKLFEKLNAKPQAKVVKAKATKVEGAGKGVSKSEPNMGNLLAEAQRTGNWTEYFSAKGLLDEE